MRAVTQKSAVLWRDGKIVWIHVYTKRFQLASFPFQIDNINSPISKIVLTGKILFQTMSSEIRATHSLSAFLVSCLQLITVTTTITIMAAVLSLLQLLLQATLKMLLTLHNQYLLLSNNMKTLYLTKL